MLNRIRGSPSTLQNINKGDVVDVVRVAMLAIAPNESQKMTSHDCMHEVAKMGCCSAQLLGTMPISGTLPAPSMVRELPLDVAIVTIQAVRL